MNLFDLVYVELSIPEYKVSESDTLPLSDLKKESLLNCSYKLRFLRVRENSDKVGKLMFKNDSKKKLKLSLKELKFSKDKTLKEDKILYTYISISFKSIVTCWKKYKGVFVVKKDIINILKDCKL